MLTNVGEAVAYTSGLVRRLAGETRRRMGFLLVVEVVASVWRVQTGFGPFDEVQPGPVRWPAEVSDELAKHGLAILVWQELDRNQGAA
jgi:hypothetical protein